MSEEPAFVRRHKITMLSADDLSPWWTDLKIGLGFLTRLPLAVRAETPAKDDADASSGVDDVQGDDVQGDGVQGDGVQRGNTGIARATRVFPLVGALIGLAGGLAFWLAHGLGLPPLAAGLIAVAATICLTGALHEDGLADVADGFGGAFARERKLEIMRDSATGAYGTLALVLSVGLRGAALAALAEPGAALAALIAAHAVSRSALPAVMLQVPLARRDGLAVAANKPEAAQAGIALALGAVMALILLGFGAGLLAVIAAGLATGAMVLVAQAHIGGYTGDVLGAIQQLAEIAVLLTAAAAL